MKGINKLEFIGILIFSVTIVGCNKNDESKKIDLNTKNRKTSAVSNFYF